MAEKGTIFQYYKEFDDLVMKLSEQFRNIEIVLLGDIFDLIRTQKYYESEGEPFTEEKIRDQEKGHGRDRGEPRSFLWIS